MRTNLLWEKAEAAAKEYVKGYNNTERRLKKSELKALKSKVTSAVKDYNLAIEVEYYRSLDKSPLEAIIKKEKVDGKKITFKVNDNNVCSMKSDIQPIKLSFPMAQHVLGDGIFESKDWFSKAEELLMVVVSNIQYHLGNKVVNETHFNETFGFEINPENASDCVKALNCVYESILVLKNKDGVNILQTTGETDEYGNPYSKEWTLIRESLTQSVEHGLELVNTSKFTEKILETMNALMCSSEYVCLQIEEDGLPEIKPAEEPTEEPAEEPAEEPEKVAKRGRKKAEKAEETTK